MKTIDEAIAFLRGYGASVCQMRPGAYDVEPPHRFPFLAGRMNADTVRLLATRIDFQRETK